MKRRLLIQGAASALACGTVPRMASAQEGRVLRILLPFTAGGPIDVAARLIGPSMSRTLNRPVVVDNKPGAAGLIATKALQQSSSDGSTTVMMTYIAFVGLPYLQKSATYDPIKEFVPVAGVAEGPAYVFVNASVPARNMAEFIAWGKTQKNGVESATSGPGGGSHMWTLLLAKRTGVNLLPVPYKGSSEMSTAVLTGDCKILIANASEALNAQVRAGKLRILGVTSDKPSALTPGVPVIADTVKDFVIQGWYGLVAAAGMPAADVAAISAAVRTALAEPGVREKFEAMYMEPRYMSPAEFAVAISRTNDFYKRLVVDIGVTPQ